MWLSVILPTFNGAAYLADALDGIVAQGDDDLEVILIDDGSEDHTVAIAESYAGQLQMQILRRPHGGNWVRNTNLGLGVARGEFVSLLHQDDVWAPDRLSTLRAAVAEVGDLTLVVHEVDYIDARGRRVGQLRCPLPERVPLPSDQVVEHLLVQNFVSLPAALFRRDQALAVGLDEGLVYTADWDLWLKLASVGVTYYLPAPLARFRVHAAAQTAKLSTGSEELRRQLEEVLARHLASLPPGTSRDHVEKAARFSIDANVALGAALRGEWAGLVRAGAVFVRLGPAGWRRYVNDSRILERVFARIRGRVKSAGAL